MDHLDEAGLARAVAGLKLASTGALVSKEKVVTCPQDLVHFLCESDRC
jgi:hypothetical protein